MPAEPYLLMVETTDPFGHESLDHLVPDDLDDGFGNWFAGFVDGEGCFTIHNRNGHYATRFKISLRDDDRRILEEIARRTGCGKVTRAYSRKRGNTKPQVIWQIANQRDSVRLVAIFDRYPLRAKKARDFLVWRAAAIESARGDQSRMAGFAQAIKKVREYRDDPIGAVHVTPRRPTQAMEFGNAI